MRKQSSHQDFDIHVDPSCLSEKFDMTNDMAADRATSSETVVHHDTFRDGPTSRTEEVSSVKSEHDDEHEDKTSNHAASNATQEKLREQQLSRIEAEIKAAARHVVATIEKDDFSGPNDSVRSERTDESYDLEEDGMGHDGVYGTELTYGDSTEASFELNHNQEERAGDSSSQHDGDIDDDVFSTSNQSKRSSLNSVHDIQSADESVHKHLTSPVVGEEAASSHDESDHEVVSRVPSGASYMHIPLEIATRTPSKIMSRPPFRTPSSVRAMQMSSPTPSIFSSPRSVKHMRTGSKTSTPISPSKRTPTRLKPRKDNPLVLLHVTLLPLQWPYSHLMSSPEVPESLYQVKDCWRLLSEKLGDTVLERGVLLPHPQDSYEVLEERLLEALELPVRPRAKILKCGHYMGPMDSELSSDEEERRYTASSRGSHARSEEQKWCDICGRDVKLEEVGEVGRGEKRFRIKIYASNGLMRAGAWLAAWKEMERVDVEIEPFVDATLQPDLEYVSMLSHRVGSAEESHANDDGFEDEDVEAEHVHDHDHEKSEEEIKLEEEIRQHEEKEEERKRSEETESRLRSIEEEAAARRKEQEERMREVYGSPSPEPGKRAPALPRTKVNEESLSELLIAAFNVLVQDRKNVVIGLLSALVLLLALIPRATTQVPLPDAPFVVSTSQIATSETISTTIDSSSLPMITTTIIQERTITERIPIPTSVEIAVDTSSQDSITAQLPLSTTTDVLAKSISPELPSSSASFHTSVESRSTEEQSAAESGEVGETTAPSIKIEGSIVDSPLATAMPQVPVATNPITEEGASMADEL